MYEHEYWNFDCNDCKIKFTVKTNIMRGFSDHEEVCCPQCKKSFGIIRADMSFEITDTKPYTREFLINGLPIEQGEVYSDGENEYWLLDWDIENKTVSYIFNPPHDVLMNEIFMNNSTIIKPFEDFKKIIKGTYQEINNSSE